MTAVDAYDAGHLRVVRPLQNPCVLRPAIGSTGIWRRYPAVTRSPSDWGCLWLSRAYWSRIWRIVNRSCCRTRSRLSRGLVT